MRYFLINKEFMTTYELSSGGFGTIQLDLVSDTVIKRQKNASKDKGCLQNESRIYQHLGDSNNYVVKCLEIKEGALRLERLDCDARQLFQNKGITN